MRLLFKKAPLRIHLIFIISLLILSVSFCVCEGADRSAAYTGWKIENSTKVYYRDGKKYTGWLEAKGNTQYIKNGRVQTGWVKVGKKKYFLNAKGVLLKNRIVGDEKQGFNFVDESGALVSDDNIKRAVTFVVNATDSGSSKKSKLRASYYALWKYPYFSNSTTEPSEKTIPDYASYMLKNNAGDCFNYATTMAYIARVLGYPVRVSFGGVTAYADRALSDHGICQVYESGEWKIIDCSMGRTHTSSNCFLVKRSEYPFRLRIDMTYRMELKNQAVTWVKVS